MLYRFVFLSALAATPLFAAPPEIANVRAEQRAHTKLVDIRYDATDADGDLLKVRIEISDNDGATYDVPACSFSGDVGAGVEPGLDKHAVWNAEADWDGEYSDRMRVKVIAVDADGFPGMDWSGEIAAGGFLLGHDGGTEGSGPARQVNVPWSYRTGAHETTVGEYCEFLNSANAAGFLRRKGNDSVWTVDGSLVSSFHAPVPLLALGDDRDIRWNAIRYEVVGDRTNFPVRVTWFGAKAFAQFYGCDLPTEAEWEKAARGPDNGAFGSHRLYTWGDVLDGSRANYCGSGDPFEPGPTPVGFYDGTQTPAGTDTANCYGIYDMCGNLAEWTRSSGLSDAESYPAADCLDGAPNDEVFVVAPVFAVRGGGFDDEDVRILARKITATGLIATNWVEAPSTKTISGGETKPGRYTYSGAVGQPIIPGSVTIVISSKGIFEDLNSNGLLIGNDISGSGIGTYSTGEWHFTLNASPSSGWQISVQFMPQPVEKRMFVFPGVNAEEVETAASSVILPDIRGADVPMNGFRIVSRSATPGSQGN